MNIPRGEANPPHGGSGVRDSKTTPDFDSRLLLLEKRLDLVSERLDRVLRYIQVVQDAAATEPSPSEFVYHVHELGRRI